MQEFVYASTDRIFRFKIALYNLDCWQISNRPFAIPNKGFVKSITGNLADWGSLGFVQAWELRPVKPALYNLVKSKNQSVHTRKRKARLEDLFELDYNTEIASSLKEQEEEKCKWDWNFIVRDYLQARQSYRDSIGEGSLGYLEPCPYFPEDKDVRDLLILVAKYSPDSIKASSSKRLRVSYK